MKTPRIIAFAALLACGPHAAPAAGSGFLFPKGREAFLVEDDLAYARCLDLLRDGTYRQINRDEHGSEEVDRGTWDQSAAGVLRLRATRHALRFHALVSGPVSVALDSRAKRDAVPALHEAVGAFLAASEDAVFSARDVAGIGGGNVPSRLDITGQAGTCSRQNLEALARQMGVFIRAEAGGVYVLNPSKNADGPPVFALEGDTFQAGDLPQVRRVYRVPGGARPPFYFVPVEARVFAREVGSWRQPRLAGSPE